MQKNTKKKDKNASPSFFDSKKNVTITAIVAALVLIITAVLMSLELGESKIVVKNDTDLKLEYVKAYYVYTEGPINEGIILENIEANKTASLPLDEINLLYTESNLELLIKFENYDEILVDAGYFNDIFKGKINVDFDQINEKEVKLNVKAKNGLLSSDLIQCDEEFTIDVSTGYVAE